MTKKANNACETGISACKKSSGQKYAIQNIGGRKSILHRSAWVGFSALFASVPLSAERALAQTYFNYDGTKTSSQSDALATWTSNSEFAYKASAPLQGDWGLAAMKAQYAYVLGFNGTGVKVGAVDSGLLTSHPEFANRGNVTTLTISGTYRNDGYQRDENDMTWKAGDKFRTSGEWNAKADRSDHAGANDNHGSHVSGTIAAAKNGLDKSGQGMMGVAWGSKYYITNSNGTDSSVYGSNMDYNYFYEAYGQLAANGVRVINSSWGSPAKFDSFASVADLSEAYASLQSLDENGVQKKKSWIDAVADVTLRTGVLQVFAAGNTNYANVNIRSAVPYFRPELEKSWLTVAALTRDLSMAGFSNECGVAKYWCLSAPGVRINSLQTTKPGYAASSGTSMAAPHVTGALGVLMQRYAGLDNEAVRTILLTTAQHLGSGPSDQPNSTFGWGIPDLQKAMNGPGQLLGQFNANIGAGVTDVWSNSISEAALKQRGREERAEVAGWPAAMAALQAKLVAVPDRTVPSDAIAAGLPNARRLLQAAIDIHSRNKDNGPAFEAALAAVNADPVGRLLLAAFEATYPPWSPGWTFSTTLSSDLKVFIAGRSDKQLADELANPEWAKAVAANAVINNQIRLLQSRVNALAAKTDASYTGSLVKTGTGSLTLTGNNSYSGGTSINEGTLGFGSRTAFGTGTVTIQNGATLQFANQNLNLSNATTLAGGVANVDTQAFVSTMSGSISGSGGLAKYGLGMLVLSGTNSYAGETNVTAGSLVVTGSIASSSLTTVQAGALLGGNGTVGNTFINGGILAPGIGMGTLTVQGDLTMTSSARYLFDVSPTNSDFVKVTGAAKLGNAALMATWAPGSYVMKRYMVMTADGGVTGKFTGPIDTNLPSSFASSLSYGRNDAYLNLTMNLAGLNQNQRNTSAALVNSFNSTGGIPFALGAVSAQGLAVASGEVATGVQQPAIAVMNNFTDVLATATAPNQAGATGAPGQPAAGTNTAAVAARPAEGYAALGMTTSARPINPSRWTMWGTGYASEINTNGNTQVGSSKTRAQLYGTTAGATYHVNSESALGFAIGGGGSNFSLSDGMGRGSGEGIQTGIFGRYGAGGAYLSGALSYGWQDTDTKRSVFGSEMRAHFDANAVAGRLENGYRIATPWVDITPYAAIAGTALFLPSYAEKSSTDFGSVFALGYGDSVVRSARREFGVRFEQSQALQDDATLVLRARTAWAHMFNTERRALASFSALPASAFTINGAAAASDSALLSGSAEVKWKNGFALAASLESELSRSGESYTGKADFKWTW